MEHGADGLFESALAALDGHDDVAWAHVATATELARTYTFVVVPNAALRERAEALAVQHDLPLVRAILAFTKATATTNDPSAFVAASELFDDAGSPSWSRLSRANAVRYFAGVGQLTNAEALLETPRRPSDGPTRGALALGELQVVLIQGQLADVARRAREELCHLPAPNSTLMGSQIGLTYESLARVAFFSGERDVLVWVVEELEAGGKSTAGRRHAAVASAHLSVLDRAADGRTGRGPNAATLRDRLASSATGGGLLQRETPYLALAAADPDWIAAERAEHRTIRRRGPTRAVRHVALRRRARTVRC